MDPGAFEAAGGAAGRAVEARACWPGSAAMRPVLDRIARVATSDVRVLLRGESGVGKEVVAREIHRRSPRAAGPFVKVNCAAVPAELLESELFGHERGAFTGAAAVRIGKFEYARDGTLLLDEIGELPARLQVKLLHVKPGAKLSMQRHHHRSEHWVVVHGTAKVVIGENEQLVRENESAYIIATQWHRLENPGKVPVEIIEVQIGSYLGEDDIERTDDIYHRSADETR